MQHLGKTVPPGEYLGTDEEVREFLAYAMRYPEFAYDTETTGLSPTWRHRALFASVCAGARRVCLPAILLPELKPLFNDPDKLCVMQNAKYDMHMTRNAGVGLEFEGTVVDTKVMSVREDSSRPNHDLKFLISDGLFHPFHDNYTQYPDFKELFIGKKNDHVAELMNPENRSMVTDYASMDAWATMTCFQELRGRLRSMECHVAPNLWELYLKLEAPLTRVLYDYERAGFPIDAAYLSGLEPEINKETDAISQEISMLVGKPINPNSNKQIADLLFSTWGLRPRAFTKGGKSGNRAPSVDEGVLKELSESASGDQKRVLELTTKYRHLVKTKGTYVVGILKLLSSLNRVHTTYEQGGAETTRLSARAPNLQNIPSRDDRFQIRAAFRAPENWKVVAFDFDQIEMKIMAALSGDQTMLDLINSGKDIHCGTVALMHDCEYDTVLEAKKAGHPTDEQVALISLRSKAKNIGFGLMYGETERRLAEQLKCSIEEAALMQRKWLDQFPGIRGYINRVHHFVQSTGYVSTILGWQRKLPAGMLNPGETPDDRRRDPEFQKAMRAAVNATIQGSAADALKVALLRVHNDPILRELQWVPLLTVHDECDGLAPAETADAVLDRCLDLATDPLAEFGIELPVSLTASGKIGDTWAEVK